MLTRAAARRQALRQLQHTADRIQLPWLCPALSRSSAIATPRRTTTPHLTTQQSQRVSHLSSPSRRLASAAPAHDDFDGSDEYLPFSYEQQRSPLVGSRASPSQLDLSSLLFIDTTTSKPPERLESHCSTELRGNSLEIEATLEACLQVQRWDRAFSVLAQLTRIYCSSPLKLQQSYNRVLEAMVFDLIWNRNTQNQDRINKWIEVDMRKAGVDPNATTFALKIKVALATLEGPRRDRTVRRYWEMAKDYQFENQVASLRSILSDSDLGKLTEICPLKIDFDLQQESIWEDEEFIAQEDMTTELAAAPVRETDQKGLGLTSLRQALSLFSDPSQAAGLPRGHDETQEEALARFRQSRLEQDSLDSAVERWKIEHDKRVKMGVSGNFSQGRVGALLWQWHELMTERIDAELELVDKAETAIRMTPTDRSRCEYGPFLRLLDPHQIAASTTIAVMQMMSKNGAGSSITLARLVTEIGRTLEKEVATQRVKDQKSLKQTKRGPTVTSSSQTSTETDNEGTRRPNLRLHNSSIYDQGLRWPLAIHAKVGAILCEMLMEVAKMNVTRVAPESKKAITVAQPVFLRRTVYKNGRKVGTLSMHEALQELLATQPAADLIAKQLPMVSKPKAWTGFSEGGYLESAQQVLRVKHGDMAQRDYAKAAADRGDLDQIYAGLDVLGSTAWKINRNVFNVMLEAWNSGQAVANLPPVEKAFPEVAKPAENATPAEKWKFYSKIRTIDNEKSGLHSNRCFQNFQMEIARAYLDETFYLPHNVDFRGRAYPIPPYLNQMGADNARGLLVFAEGRRLGPDGLRWLQIQLANVFGYDKASLKDRAQFALDHLEDIKDSVDNPLDGKRWWLKAEDPWQCLAACHELTNAFKLDDPTNFVSHLPVHQDGSCNGLQHYAALGGDVAGARQVNLEPGDKPADVYTGVAELVKAEIRRDAAEGVEIAQLLDGRITRKIVKQTVMTNVYGVTFTGAIRQVRKQVDDILPDLVESGKGGAAATYIAKNIFKGLGTLFEGAHEIQYWLGDCASRITHSISNSQLQQIALKEFGNAKDVTKNVSGEASVPSKKRKKADSGPSIETSDFKSTVIWTTPLRLPVVQPYRINYAQTIHTNMQNISLAEPGIADAVDPRKQLQGFPPNFVHSLDATHMMLSALKAREIGIQFSAVHDSFWTHAANVDTLNVLLRDAFIRMHSEDIISRLAAEFRARYQGHMYLAKINGDSSLARRIASYRKKLTASMPKIKKARKGRAFIKHKRYEELVRELKRSRLLASEDPQEREEGKAMVTAATLFEQFGGERHLSHKVSLGQTAIGEIPEIDPHAVEEIMQAESVNSQVQVENVLEPLLQNGDDAVSTTTESGKLSESPTEAKKKKSSGYKNTLWLWLPLTFRDVPKKGEFDVRRLKDSTYFFS